LGCDQAQGFYFGPPVPATEFADLLYANQSHSDTAGV